MLCEITEREGEKGAIGVNENEEKDKELEKEHKRAVAPELSSTRPHELSLMTRSSHH